MADIVTIIPANPLVFVVGYENLKAMLEDGLIANTKNLSNIFHTRFNEIRNKYPNHLKYLFGKGFLEEHIFMN